MLETNKVELKIVGATGQVCIGKEYAGKQIQLLKQDDSTIIIKKGQFIPDNERWLYRDNNLEKLMKAVEISKKNPRRADNFEEIMSKLEASINE
jgi:hypothetical protein